MKVYRLVSGGSGGEPGILVKLRVFLKDRPGSLASLSSLIASCGGNISIFLTNLNRATYPATSFSSKRRMVWSSLRTT